MLRFKSGELEVAARAPILSQGVASPYLYTVLDGFGVRSRALADGRRQVINFVMPGDLIGVQTALLNEMDHSVDATTAMTLCVFTRERFWELFKASPERAFDVSWIAAREERSLGEALAVVGRLSAVERVAAAFVTIFRRSGDLNLVRGGKAPMPWTQRDLSDALGLSLVHTNRTLKKLEADGLAIWRGAELEVRDLARLAEIGQVDLAFGEKRPLM